MLKISGALRGLAAGLADDGCVFGIEERKTLDILKALIGDTLQLWFYPDLLTGVIVYALKAIGAGGGYLWSKRMQEQKAAMEQATEGTGVEVTQTNDNRLKLEIPSDISFDSGRADIKPSLRPVLDKLAQGLAQHPVTRVTIVGHTDNVGSDAVNNPLSVNRAAAVRDYLVPRGVASSRIGIDGRGSREPVADNATAQGRAMNRRVEIFVAETSGG